VGGRLKELADFSTQSEGGMGRRLRDRDILKILAPAFPTKTVNYINGGENHEKPAGFAVGHRHRRRRTHGCAVCLCQEFFEL